MLQRLATCRMAAAAAPLRRLGVAARHLSAAPSAADTQTVVEEELTTIISGPAWDLTAAYAGLDSPGLASDVATSKERAPPHLASRDASDRLLAFSVRSLIEELAEQCACKQPSHPHQQL